MSYCIKWRLHLGMVPSQLFSPELMLPCIIQTVCTVSQIVPSYMCVLSFLLYPVQSSLFSMYYKLMLTRQIVPSQMRVLWSLACPVTSIQSTVLLSCISGLCSGSSLSRCEHHGNCFSTLFIKMLCGDRPFLYA